VHFFAPLLLAIVTDCENAHDEVILSTTMPGKYTTVSFQRSTGIEIDYPYGGKRGERHQNVQYEITNMNSVLSSRVYTIRNGLVMKF
jgi:hypothetical protein